MVQSIVGVVLVGYRRKLNVTVTVSRNAVDYYYINNVNIKNTDGNTNNYYYHSYNCNYSNRNNIMLVILLLLLLLLLKL